jgi:hypothetical protein
LWRNRFIAGGFLTLLAGCQSHPRLIEVMDYPADGPPQTYQQEFDVCYFRKAPDGNLDIVAQRWPKAGDVNRAVASQTLELRVFYDPIPSRSPSDPTMTNALVSYKVVGDGFTCSFDGGGFVSWEASRWDDRLIFFLERAVLKPQRVLDNSTPIFEQPRVTGKLTAVRDDRKVITVLNELRRTFGPLPDEKPPLTDPRLR